ncbi:uncharacterized protein [Penaeus vannamei]|uniref:uncharacterized protein n=1 Tax=Penaeus vannamei TaxID=6689 RepID=UPI00387FA241
MRGGAASWYITNGMSELLMAALFPPFWPNCRKRERRRNFAPAENNDDQTTLLALSYKLGIPWSKKARLLTLRMKTLLGFVNIISAYAPTLTSSPQAKDQFYEALEDVVSGNPCSEGIYLLGDVNARVGTDWQAWPICLSHFSIGQMNENGQRLLEVYCHQGLCITNSYYKCKELQKVSWRVGLRSYHSADCDTDHSLVASKVRLKPRKIHHAKTKGRPRINTYVTSNPIKAQCFADNSAIAAFGKKEHKSADWFKSHWDEMQPVAETKRKALLAYKQNPCPSTHNTLQAARSKAQQTVRRCANKYWQNLCANIQLAADESI